MLPQPAAATLSAFALPLAALAFLGVAQLAGRTHTALAQTTSSHPTLQTAPVSTSEPTPVSTAPTISVDARLVNLPVIVRDKKGALVQTLTKDNFILQVDSKPQTIRYFNQDKDLPLTLGLLVDVSGSMRNAIDEERTASTAFLDDMLTGPADRDKAFVIQFAHQTDLLQDVTSSRPKLQAALKQLDSPSQGGGGYGRGQGGNSSDPNDPNDTSNGNGNNNGRGRRGGGGGGGGAGAGTTLYDALFLSSDELMSKQKGRKALIILTDGDDNGSKETLNKSIEAAQRADTIVYGIYFKGQSGGGGNQNNQPQQRQGGGMGRGGGIGFPGGGGGYPGGGGGGYPGGGGGNRPGGNQESRTDGKKILAQMAEQTGGRLFEVSRKQTFAQIYTQIGEELRAQYRLGYTPDKETAGDGYHQVDLALTKASPKNLTIQTRDGYYTGK